MDLDHPLVRAAALAVIAGGGLAVGIDVRDISRAAEASATAAKASAHNTELIMEALTRLNANAGLAHDVARQNNDLLTSFDEDCREPIAQLARACRAHPPSGRKK
jgi:ABC-type transporter Mla subunit MlaD